MTPRQALLIVWAWRKLAIGTLIATVLITLVVSLLMPKSYTASASIYIDLKPDPILGTMGSMTSMSTQSEIIQSRRVASRVVKMLRIGEIPSVFQSWKEDTAGKISIEEYYGELLLRGLAVRPAQNSSIITLSYSSSDPRFAATAANAFAQATLDTNIELRVDPAREYAAWFDERLKTLRANLEAAQQKLSAYQRQNGIVATDSRLDQELIRLNALENDLSVVQGQKADITSREKNTGSELSPDVMQSPLIQGLKSEIAKAETGLNAMGSNVGKNHPQKLQLEAQLVGLKQQLAMEIQRISGGVAKANRVSTQKEIELRSAIDAQRKRVLDLRAEQDKISILRQDVESAQRAYESVAQRMSLSALESHSQQTNLSILSAAIEPTTASRPKVLVNVGASVLVGLLLAFAVAVGREYMDRRARDRDDLADFEGIPFLGFVRPKDRHQFLRGRWAKVFGWVARKIWNQRPVTRTAGAR